MNSHNEYVSTAADGFVKQNKALVQSIRKFTAKLQTQDFIGIIIFFALLPMGFLYAVTFPLSFWNLFYGWLMRVVPCSLLGLNVYLNALMLIKVGPNSNGDILPSVVKAAFHFCHQCQTNSPPRSFHCPVCDFCVLRRDHHCSFTASCVGHFNQRYFVAAVFNLWPIALVCCVWNWNVLLLAFSPLSPLDLLKWVFPHVALLLRSITFYQFLVVLAFAFSLITLLFTTYLIAAQLFGFWRGQTRVEFLMEVHAYNVSFRENLAQGLGTRWPLILLSPFITSPLESDGTFFGTREREAIGKSTKYF
uniref:Palmitoyltransferase n=1 Tax=Globodera pallida TaxID=36090 RepID=A0A183CJT0_GLOPA